jgi:hypothetical protein
MEDSVAIKLPPKVFISYSWDSENHKKWVRDFAARLRGHGIDVILDQWEVVPGDQLPSFMEQSVMKSDFVLCICTPRYQEKTNNRTGGVVYEEDIITGELYRSQDQRKFIPILRTGNWEASAPIWMGGKSYIDLQGDPYSEKKYTDLLRTLHNMREGAPPIGVNPMENNGNGVANPVGNIDTSSSISIQDQKNSNTLDDFEFVNRKIELATLDPARLSDSYWQVMLVSAPTGYGKTYLLKRLMNNIENDPVQSKNWNIAYVDLKDCKEPNNVIRYIARMIIGKEFTSDVSDEDIKKIVQKYVLEEMCRLSNNGARNNVMLILDSIDSFSETFVPWLSSLIHDAVIDSYFDYENDAYPFAVRFIISGTEPDIFWSQYKEWEKPHVPQLRPPDRLSLSPFESPAIADLIYRRAKKEGLLEGLLKTSGIHEISYSLQFLSGGHPQVISDILDELAKNQFLQYKNYFKINRENLVKVYISKVAYKILSPFSDTQDRRDIRTVCLLRLNDLSTLQALWSAKLLSFPRDMDFFQRLCKSKILKVPNRNIRFYHDDIIRRILSLDFTYGIDKDVVHIQKVHKCAKSLYCSWIEDGSDERSIHYFFNEWLFHALQIDNLAGENILSEWKSLLSKLNSSTLPIEDIRQTIREQLESDSEVKYLYRGCFGTDGLSKLFE